MNKEERLEKAQKWLEENVIVVVDSASGIYCPKEIAEKYGNDLQPELEDAVNILLEGPEHPEYWDAWEEVLSEGIVKDDAIEEGLFIVQAETGDVVLLPPPPAAIEDEVWELL